MTGDKFQKATKGYKKITIYILTAVSILIGGYFDLTPEQMLELTALGTGTILAQAHQDAQIERTRHLNQEPPANI